MSGCEGRLEHRIGHYRILGELARGGMGIVYRAQDPGGRAVALKVLLGLGTPHQRQRFAREVEAAGRLDHPAIVRVLDHGEHQGRPYMVQELVAGEPLEERLARRGPLEPTEAARITAAVARALEHAHQRGVLHRDVKPSNVLVDGEAVKLADFGLAGAHGDLRASRTALTREGAALGTPGYWSPEQATGDLARVGPASDVYGLGATLYALLTGRPPCLGDSLLEQVAAAVQRPPQSPRALRPEVPRALEEVCLRCLAKAPEERFPSAGALAQALEGPPERRRAARWRRAGAALGVALLAAGATLMARRSTPAAAPAPSAAADPGAGAAEPDAQPAADLPAPHAGAATRVEELVARAREEGRRDPAAAAEALAEAARLAPPDPDRLAHLGHQALAVGAPRQALALFERALTLDPDHLSALAGRGGTWGVLQEPERGRPDLERALALDPTHSLALYARGTARLHQGDAEGALEDLSRALEGAPDHVPTLTNRAAAWTALGRVDEAQADYERLLARHPDSVTGLLNLGRLLLFERRQVAAAEELLERAIRLDPERHEGWLLRAQASELRGDQEQAASLAQEALQRAPQDPGPYLLLARIRSSQGRPAEGVELLSRALERGLRQRVVYEQRVALRLEAGDTAGAVEDLTQLLFAAPQDITLRRQRAGLLQRQGLYAAALRDLDEVVRLAPTPRHLAQRGWLRLQSGAAAEALADAERALDGDPDLALALHLRGDALQAQGRPGAEAAWRRALETAGPRYPLRGALRQRLGGE